MTTGRARCGERRQRLTVEEPQLAQDAPGRSAAARARHRPGPSPRCRAADPRTRSPAALPRRPCTRCARRTRAEARRRSASAPDTISGAPAWPRGRGRARRPAASPDGPRVARFLKPRASADSGMAKLGALQPSVAMRQARLGRARTRRRRRARPRAAPANRDRGSARARRRACARRARKPACLPEQLWRSGSRSSPAHGWRPAMRMPIGQCAPHRRSLDAGARPSRAGARRRRDGCRRRRATRPRAPAPRRRSPARRRRRSGTSGSACSGLIAERVNVTSSGSPSACDDAAVAVDDRDGGAVPGFDAVAACDHGGGGKERARPIIAASYSAAPRPRPDASGNVSAGRDRARGLRTLLRAMTRAAAAFASRLALDRSRASPAGLRDGGRRRLAGQRRQPGGRRGHRGNDGPAGSGGIVGTAGTTGAAGTGAAGSTTGTAGTTGSAGTTGAAGSGGDRHGGRGGDDGDGGDDRNRGARRHDGRGRQHGGTRGHHRSAGTTGTAGSTGSGRDRRRPGQPGRPQGAAGRRQPGSLDDGETILKLTLEDRA